ncbi:hypothetical protein D3C85_936610 [compost metagenome]
MQLLAYLIAERIGNQHAHLSFALHKGLHIAAEEIALQHNGCGLPILCRIHVVLPAVVKTAQVVVGVQVLDLLSQLTQQRSLTGFTQVIDELAVTLIQPEPLAGVFLHAISQRFHL